MWINGDAPWKANAVMHLTSKHVALYSQASPYFTTLSRIESWPAPKQYLFAAAIAKNEANVCTKCPCRYDTPAWFSDQFLSPGRTWLVTAPRRYFEMDRIVDFGIECIAEGSVLSSRFIPLLASSQFVAVYARSARSNMSAHSPFYLRSRSWISSFR